MLTLNMIHILDVTGSMGAFIHAAKDRMIKLVAQFEAELDKRITLQQSLIVFRDHPPQESSFVYKILVDGQDLSVLRSQLAQCKASGGGDIPEVGLDALHAISQLQCLEQRRAINKVFVWGDAPFHGTRKIPCNCGLTSADILTIKEAYELEIFAFNLSGAQKTTQSFETFADNVFSQNARHPVLGVRSKEAEVLFKMMIEELNETAEQCVQAIDVLLPILEANRYAQVSTLAKELLVSDRDIRNWIGVINRLGLLPTDDSSFTPVVL